MPQGSLKYVQDLLRPLSDREKRELVEFLLQSLQGSSARLSAFAELWKPIVCAGDPSGKSETISFYGILADLGPAPSSEDIEEARAGMLQNFPRDDIA